jgi:hypothetical protein
MYIVPFFLQIFLGFRFFSEKKTSQYNNIYIIIIRRLAYVGILINIYVYVYDTAPAGTPGLEFCCGRVGISRTNEPGGSEPD